MSFLLRLCVILFLLLWTPTISAQDASLPVVKSEDIITNSVEIVERLPLVNINDNTRTLYYFDPALNEWLEYPYPDGLEAIEDARYYLRRRSDGTYVINAQGFWVFSQDLASEVWIFDPITGSFSHPEAACGLILALPGEGEWVIVEDEEASESYVCFTETGEMSPSIPSLSPEFKCLHNWRQPVVTSPDNRWALLVCGGLQFDAYGYDAQTRQFHYLGRSTEGENENVEVIRWINNTRAIIHSFPSWNPPANTYYIADVAQANSFEFIAWELYAAPLYHDDPLHLEWMPCEFGLCSVEPEAGGLRYYDFGTQELTVYPRMERIDGVSDVIPDGSGDRLYRSLNYEENDFWKYDPAPTATLIRFNYDTLRSDDSYTGEIEWVDSFSPDGRYVVLCIGHDRAVASNALLSENQADYTPDADASLMVLDLHNNEFVAEALDEAQAPCTDNPFALFTFGNEPRTLTWLEENTFFVRGTNADQIVRLGEEVEIVADLKSVESASLSPDNQGILVWDKLNQVSIYDIATDTIIPVILSSAFDEYTLFVRWQSANELLVTAVEATDDEDNYRELARWRVRIPS